YSKCASPTKPRRNVARIQQQKCGRSAKCRADPVRTVDDQIDAAAHARRNQFVNRRIDGRVFAANARARDRAKERIAPEVPGQSGHLSPDEITRTQDEEEFLATNP